jgi:3-oxoacyl-[acyl-carrier protein] reductase
MSDRYQSFTLSSLGSLVSKQAGLPQPPVLARYEIGQPVVSGPVLVGGAPGGRLLDGVVSLLKSLGADVRTEVPAEVDGSKGDRNAALVFDATGITSSASLRALYDFFHPVARSLTTSGRVIVLGTPPEDCGTAGERIAQRALEGFVRAVGKEFGKGTTANLVYVRSGAEDATESTLRFFLSARSAYVSGQVVRVGQPGSASSSSSSGSAAGSKASGSRSKAGAVTEPSDWDQPLAGKVALVTGAARGIGEAIASTLARDGATVVALDVPGAGEALSKVANRIGGLSLQLDITSPDAPTTLADYLTSRFGGVDIVVHNAGVTRDKTIANMDEKRWDMTLDINLSSQERINDVLLSKKVLKENGRIVAVSSVSGIAGNRGQTNYATSKAGVIGLVDAFAPELAKNGSTINAVAPGFIETEMTAAMPLFVREGGRRLNSMLQGGQPVDVAETIAWLASPASAGVNGNLVRVCGQALIGA